MSAATVPTTVWKRGELDLELAWKAAETRVAYSATYIQLHIMFPGKYHPSCSVRVPVSDPCTRKPET